jgi:hypothetical protein
VSATFKPGAEYQTTVRLSNANGMKRSDSRRRLHSTGNWRFSHFRIGTELESNPFLALALQCLQSLEAPDRYPVEGPAKAISERSSVA